VQLGGAAERKRLLFFWAILPVFLLFPFTPFQAVAADQAPVESAPFPLTGRLYTDQYMHVYYPDANTETFAQSSFTAWLELSTHEKESLNIHGIATETLFLKSLEYPETVRGQFNLREEYLSYANDWLEVKAGQQIIPWGKSDGINPTDYWTAKDYTVLNPDDEVKRTGAPAFSVSFTPDNGASPLTFTAIVQSSYAQAKLLIPDSAVPSVPVPFKKYPDSVSLFSGDTMEYGGKVAYLQPKFDFSLSVFRGYAAMPHYEFDGSKIFATNAAELAIGGDLSFTLDSYIIRFESALHMPDDGTQTDPYFGLVEPYHWDSVLGVERPVFTDFRIQIQGLYRYHLYYLSPDQFESPNPMTTPIYQAVGRANALILNYQDQSIFGGTFRFAYQPENGDWTADLVFVGYVGSGSDFVTRPQVSYKPAEGFKLTAGAEIYGGDPNRPLSSNKNFSTVYFEGKWVF